VSDGLARQPATLSRERIGCLSWIAICKRVGRPTHFQLSKNKLDQNGFYQPSFFKFHAKLNFVSVPNFESFSLLSFFNE